MSDSVPQTAATFERLRSATLSYTRLLYEILMSIPLPCHDFHPPMLDSLASFNLLFATQLQHS